jgi:hypothetical protein
MPKVVSGKGFDDFVQTGKHQVIDDKKKPTDQPKVEPPKEVKELIAKAEAETAKDMEPKAEPEDDGLEADDKELAERAQQRIAKKHREMKQAEALAKKLREELDDTENFSKAQYQRAQAAEEEAARLRKELEGKQTAPAPQAEKSGLQPPDENDPKFRNDKGEFQLKVYEKARDEYVKAQFREELKAEAEAKEREAEWKSHEKRLDAFRAVTPDYDEIVGPKGFEVLPYMARFIVQSDVGPEIGFHFAQHPEDYERIKALHPIRGSAEMGKLEAKFQAAKEKKPEVSKETQASAPKPTPPAPITPLSGQGSPGVNSDPAKMSPKELLAYTREREAAKKRARLGG